MEENYLRLVKSLSIDRERRIVEDKGQHLVNLAARARRFADECESPLVQDLYEIHASLCNEKSS